MFIIILFKLGNLSTMPRSGVDHHLGWGCILRSCVTPFLIVTKGITLQLASALTDRPH